MSNAEMNKLAPSFCESWRIFAQTGSECDCDLMKCGLLFGGLPLGGGGEEEELVGVTTI